MRSTLTSILWTTFGTISAVLLVLAAAFLYLNPQVPDAASFKNVKLRAPLRIYTADEKLIQEFGERLTPITYEQIPASFINALLDTEDKRFFEHSGIDLITVFNAAWQLVRNKGSIRTGASTITMQLVKNISGATEVRFIRKFREMLLALKIERELTKEEILTLYLNIIPFGKHAFGIQAAANTYYGKDIDQLNLAQIAMLAGIPQAPEAGNPVNGPERAVARRNLVLLRMLGQKSIKREEYDLAVQAPITAKVHGRVIELPALYAAEIVRKHLLKQYGAKAYDQGLVIHTTLDSVKQKAAELAVQTKLNEYDRRHGYRGPEHHQIDGTNEYLAAPEYGYPANFSETLKNATVPGNQLPGIVLAVRELEIDVLTRAQEIITIGWQGLRWARPYVTVNQRGARPVVASDIVSVGDVIRYQAQADDSWSLGQIPDIQGALVSLNPQDGAILALVGGYDFRAQQFNHATQARRQPGSNFKPFYYAGAMEDGLTAASIYNDAPLVLDGGEQEQVYRPKNSGGFAGNLRLREALYKSKNMVSLRVLLDYGPENAISYVKRFGFDTSNFPPNVQLAFGGGTIALTPLEIATGYAAFANGGYKVNPYLISSIDSIGEDIAFLEKPVTVCPALREGDCELPPAKRIIEPRVAYVMNSILSDVITRGTGRKVLASLNRGDLKGKTGTTNDADIWFSGFTNDLVATIWTGFDDNSPVGNREFGSTTPLETWVAYMQEVLPPEFETSVIPFPDSLVKVRIDPITGHRADSTDPNAIFEMFREEYAPAPSALRVQEEIPGQPLQQIF